MIFSSWPDGTLVFDVPRGDATVEWPFWLMGGACRVKTPAGAWIVSFGRPFPDAPSPDHLSIPRATSVLEGVHQQPAEALAKAMIMPEPGLSDTKVGRSIGPKVKAAL
ncbi:hypothetical protein [Actinoplanes couchii]|uniref:Uncharacterized protein n=1 Tax=Actinoplanes couchii TaxID=403638 RepID=A0ABQ3XQL0_9ACTN|nr:hypothetical protein [Actinoplanes couchii]MDR6317468.1 hypothetical protein [Actinoplanes couchii]GID60769.1 hypothetical protein Aco03nite_091730 [Actinoplanes couchii]